MLGHAFWSAASSRVVTKKWTPEIDRMWGRMVSRKYWKSPTFSTMTTFALSDRLWKKPVKSVSVPKSKMATSSSGRVSTWLFPVFRVRCLIRHSAILRDANDFPDPEFPVIRPILEVPVPRNKTVVLWKKTRFASLEQTRAYRDHQWISGFGKLASKWQRQPRELHSVSVWFLYFRKCTAH